MKSVSREENLADLRKLVAALEKIEALFDQIIANTEAAHEKRKRICNNKKSLYH